MKTETVDKLKRLGIYSALKKAKLWSEKRTRGTMTFYSKFIRKGELCFDIGANTGARTEIFLGLGANVVAVEPQPACVAVLTKAFVYPRSSATIVAKAIGAAEGTGTLSLSDDASVIATMSDQWRTEGRFSKEHSWTKTISVPMTTLNALISQYGTPAFCKVDVEGFEEEVFKGLNKKIPCVSFEFTIEFIDAGIRIADRLSTLGILTCNYSVGESHSLALSEWISKEELFKRIEAESVADLWGDIYIKMT